jgi:hypothetical protein
VTPEEKAVLRRQWIGYLSVRDVGFMMILAAIWRGLLLLNPKSLFGTPADIYLPEFLAMIVGLPRGLVVILLWVVIQFVLGAGLLSFTRWGYKGAWLMVLLSALSALCPAAFGLVAYMRSPQDVNATVQLISQATQGVIYLLFWLGALYILSKKFTRTIFSERPRASGSEAATA